MARRPNNLKRDGGLNRILPIIFTSTPAGIPPLYALRPQLRDHDDITNFERMGHLSCSLHGITSE